jgi:hypothetical protein
MQQCPACGSRIEGEEFCSWCGLAQSGPDALEIHSLAGRLSAIDAELYKYSRERDDVAARLQAKRYEATRGALAHAVATRPAVMTMPAPVSAPRERAEWNVDRVRTILLWVGAALLATSAITFTAVAWSHLGDAGRAALLVAFTVVSMMIAVATRKRLPATAEAFTALTVALGLVDWLALRRAGAVPGMSATTWWAFGSVIFGLLGFGLGEVTAPKVGRRAAALLLPTGALLAMTVVAGNYWSFGLGLALLAGALALVRRFVRGDAFINVMLGVDAIVLWVGGAITAGFAAAQPNAFAEAVPPAIGVLALGVAPLVVRRYELVVGAVLGTLLTLAAPLVAADALLAFAGVSGLLVIAASPLVPQRLRDSFAIAGGAFAIPGAAWFASVVAVMLFGPLAWFHTPWTGNLRDAARSIVSGPHTGRWTLGSAAVIAVGIAGVLALLSVSAPKGRRLVDTELGLVLATGVAIMSACMAPVVFGASALVAFVLALALGCVGMLTGAVIDRVRPRLGLGLLGVSLLALVPAAGWAATTAHASIAALAVGIVMGTVAAFIARSDVARTALSALAAVSAIVLAPVVAVFAGASPAAQAFATFAVAGPVFLVGVLARGRHAEGPVLECVGAAAMVIGGIGTFSSLAWLAGALTIGAACLLVAALRQDRTAVYAPLSAALLLGAAGAWLASASVPRGESGLLVVALAASMLLLGTLVRRDNEDGPWLEGVGAVGVGIGLLVAAPATAWLAAALTLMIPVLLLAALDPERAAVYRGVAAATLVGAAGAWLGAAHVARGEAGFIAGALAGALLLVGALLRRDEVDGEAVEFVGAAGIVVGCAIAIPSLTWLAACLTLAVPVFAIAALRLERMQAYGVAAVAAALGATWARLAAAQVTVVEAYTLPAAAVALAAGYVTWKRGPGRSWLALGPAIVIALGPTLDLAIKQNDSARSILVAAGALAVILFGAWKRLQAPLVLGSAALLILAIDTFGPAAARLPRWVPLAIAGVLLMWVGARFERSREAARRASQTFQHFG